MSRKMSKNQMKRIKIQAANRNVCSQYPCQQPSIIDYMDILFCDKHWNEFCGDEYDIGDKR